MDVVLKFDTQQRFHVQDHLQYTISKMFDPVVLFTFLIVLLYQFYQ